MLSLPISILCFYIVYFKGSCWCLNGHPLFLLHVENYFPAVQTTVSGIVVCLSPLLLTYVRQLPLGVFSTPQQQTSYEPVKSEIVTRGNDIFSVLCVYSLPPFVPYSLYYCTNTPHSIAFFTVTYVRTHCMCTLYWQVSTLCLSASTLELPPGGISTVSPSTSHSPTASMVVTTEQGPQSKEDSFIHLLKLYAAKVRSYTPYKCRYQIMHQYVDL